MAVCLNDLGDLCRLTVYNLILLNQQTRCIMPNDINLQQMISALDEMDFEKRTTTSLADARTQAQMTACLSGLDYSAKRLELLQNAVNAMVEDKRHGRLKQEKIQTFKTKIINLSREYQISYAQVLEVMVSLHNRK
jgi:hypothetical protein